jgi:hypothetical protein
METARPRIRNWLGGLVVMRQRSLLLPPGAALAVDLPQAPAAPQATNEQLKKAVDEINRAMQQSGRNLQFSVDSATDRW